MSSDQPKWEGKAQRYSEMRHGTTAALVYPAILRRVDAEANARTLLDFGCGDGRLLEQMPERLRLSALDVSPRMRELAAERLGNRLERMYASREELPDAGFDVVASSLVLMTIGSEAEYRATLADVFRALRPGGVFLVALTHPCFRATAFADFQAEFADGAPFEYFDEGRRFRVLLKGPRGKLTIEDYHWTLGFTLTALADAGFRIEAVEEPAEPSGRARVPPYLILIARKGVASAHNCSGTET